MAVLKARGTLLATVFVDSLIVAPGLEVASGAYCTANQAGKQNIGGQCVAPLEES